MKVKFDRMKIIAALKESRTSALEQYHAKLASFPKLLDAAKKKYAQRTKDFIREIETAKEDMPKWNYSNRESSIDWPDKPRKPNLEKVDALISQLQLSDEKIILCDTKEDYIALTRTCNITGCCQR